MEFQEYKKKKLKDPITLFWYVFYRVWRSLGANQNNMTQNQKERLIHLFEIGWAPDLVDYVESLLTTPKADWLRSEIEKVEGMKLMKEEREGNQTDHTFKKAYNTALTSIITRYKEELKELTGE